MSTEKETPQFYEGKKVDFEMLIDFENFINDTLLYTVPVLHKEIANFMLFMEMLSKSSSFAHKAHKELQKLS